MAYSYTRTITIDKTKCGSSDSTNFPVLISGTYSELATVANGGKVTNSSGFDIIFTSDSAGATKLDHQIESYDATTGAIRMWVRVPTVTYATDTVIYLFYGNSDISTTQENVTGTWESNFKVVMHLNDNTASTTVLDSTSNAYNGTAAANTNTKTTTGQVGAGLNFNGTSDQITLGDIAALDGLSSFTVSFWTNLDSTAGSGNPNFAADTGSAGLDGWQVEANTSNIYFSLRNNADGYITSAKSYSGLYGAIHHIAMVYDGSLTGNSNRAKYYLDGAIQTWGSQSGTVPSSLSSNTGTFTIGNLNGTAGDRIKAWMDEFHFATTPRSADWILKEYNNQNSPSTFYAVGAEASVTAWLPKIIYL